MHFGKKEEGPMSEKTCVGRNGLGKLQRCAWAGGVGRSGFLASRVSFGKVSLQKGSAIQCQISRLHRKNIQSPRKASSAQPFSVGLRTQQLTSVSFLLSFLFPLVCVSHRSYISGEKCKTANFTPSPPPFHLNFFIVFYILSSIIAFSFLIRQAGCSREQAWLFPVVLHISAMPCTYSRLKSVRMQATRIQLKCNIFFSKCRLTLLIGALIQW